jgi:pantoate--beta-alanine ligase
MTDIISSEPLAKLHYVSCTDFDTLKELEEASGKALISMAVYFGKTRLIDNFVLG